MNKPRSDSILFQLTEEQQAQIYDWIVLIGYEKTKDRLAEPPPTGFDIKTHLCSLRRFYVRYSQTVQQEDLELASPPPAGPPTAIAAATENAIHHAAFQLSAAPPDPDTFNQLSRWLNKQKAHEQKAEYIQIARDNLAVARERLALDREKMELNYARLALKYALELHQINTHPGWDDEDKVRAARDKLFPKPQPIKNESK